MPDEAYNRIELKQMTASKDDVLDDCYQWGRQLRLRLKLAFGQRSPEFQAFPAEQFRMALYSEKIMYSVMEIMISLANKYSEPLLAYGQTQEFLDQGPVLLENLRTADEAQEVKKDEKRSATEERHQIFQALYSMVNRINRIGRMVFENDPVKLALFISKWPRYHAEEAVA